MSAAAPKQVYQVVYHSIATHPMPSSADNASLLEQARAYNNAHGITGLLLYAETTGEYLQVLEGEPETVKALYERIKADPRHHSVGTVAEGVMTDRALPNWRMGFAPLEADELGQLAGYINPRAMYLPDASTALLDLLADFARTRDVEY